MDFIMSYGLEQNCTQISVKKSLESPYILLVRAGLHADNNSMISGVGKRGISERWMSSHSCRVVLDYLDAAFPETRLDFLHHDVRQYFSTNVCKRLI